MDLETIFMLYIALSAELQAAKAAIQAGQPTTIGDPSNPGAGAKTYLYGKHVAISVVIAPVQ